MTPLNKQVKGSCSRLSHTNQKKPEMDSCGPEGYYQVMHNFVIYGELFALDQGFYMVVYATLRQ